VELTRDEAIKNHRAMWNWLAENPSKEKKDWPGWDGMDIGEVCGECFACEYSSGCSECLFIWPGQDCCNRDDNNAGLFEIWENQGNLEKRAVLALQIANLPEREVKE